MLMFFNNWMLIFYLFFMGLISFILIRKHLLSMLLSLEFIVLSLFFMVLYFLSFLNFELYFCMFFLIFSVCEGALGVSLMVLMIRSHGNDYFKSLSILQC